ncbi:hypothetical protein [Streptococcus koreensis]|uniref:hypothetical protein n=1 Tax=Streptococcus koreensis TaxID=2382163 RepID=UPI0022E08E40|nr:hypothetical protein [Streptococcus koreensis]
MKTLKQGLLLVVTFFVFLGLIACSLEREETYEKKTKDTLLRVTIRHRSNQMISEEFWADNFNVHIEDDSQLEYIKKEIVDPKRGISGYTTDVSRTKEGGLMVHTKIVYQDLDVEALNKANDDKKTFGELANYSEHIKNFKKEGYKRIK